MSALTPHIRALLAEAKALSDAADKMGQPTTEGMFAAQFTLIALASAKLDAAQQLEREEQALTTPLVDVPIDYNPKRRSQA